MVKQLLIRAEEIQRRERRTPITPSDLGRIMTATGARTFVQHSDNRIFTDAAYASVGASLCRDMEEGEIVLGIKEIPAEKIVPGKTYLFFSHTVKGQAHNMPLLQKIIHSESTLIDYEKITDEKGRRALYFGPYAGHAGTLDILSLMGAQWADQGIRTPLAEVRRAHQYGSVAAAKAHMTEISEKIQNDGFAPELSPLTVGILGYGNVSSGAQEILDCLPTRRVPPEDLEELTKKRPIDRHRVFVSVFKEKDLVRPKDRTEAFSLSTYLKQPERYESRFEPYLSHLTLLINAVYWESRYPRFVTWKNLREMAHGSARPKLNAIADISCDIEGAIQCTVRSTNSDDPAYRVDPKTETIEDGHLGDGILLLAVDNLPSELPMDASTFFSRQLHPLVTGLLMADTTGPITESGLSEQIQRATIVYNGRLTEPYAYLNAYLTQKR